MTQEQLAMLLGVSRQAISKWESEKAYPEMDKLLMICDMFGVTLDDLVMGDVRESAVVAKADATHVAHTVVLAGQTGMPGSATAGPLGFAASQAPRMSDSADSDVCSANSDARVSVSPESDIRGDLYDPQDSVCHIPQDVVGYDDHMTRFTWLTATGVALIILGTAVGMLFSPEGSILGQSSLNDVLLTVCVLLGAIIGLALLIPAGVIHGDFRRRHPYVQDFYTEEDKSRASTVLAIGVVTGVVLALVGVCARVLCSELVAGEGAGWPDSILLACVAIAVFCFILAGMMHGKVNVDKYNRESEEESAREGRSVPNPMMSESDRFYSRLTSAICGVIMLLATAAALLMLFLGMTGDDGGMWMKVFWIPWPISGVLCGVVGVVVPLVKDAKHR